MIVTDGRVARFVGERVNRIIYPPFTCLGREVNGDVVAGVVFNCFTGASMDATAAGNGWTRPVLRAVGAYVFEQMQCTRLGFITEQSEVARLATKLGAVKEGVLLDYFGGGRDATILGVTRDRYRY